MVAGGAPHPDRGECPHVPVGDTQGSNCSANLAPLCRFHNRLKHRLAIRARRRADGDIEWTRPDGTPITVRWPHHLLRPIEDEDPTSGPDP